MRLRKVARLALLQEFLQAAEHAVLNKLEVFLELLVIPPIFIMPCKVLEYLINMRLRIFLNPGKILQRLLHVSVLVEQVLLDGGHCLSQVQHDHIHLPKQHGGAVQHKGHRLLGVLGHKIGARRLILLAVRGN